MTAMSLALRIQEYGAICAAGAVIALAGAVAAATPADADIVSVADMLHGISSTSAQCAATPQAAWITVKSRSFCMRYYLASSGGEDRKPIVFLQGDRLGVLNLKTGAFAVPAKEQDINTDDLMRAAVALSRQFKTTAIYLARVGVEGSSGDHRLRHSILELQATNAALDAIKQKHKFESFHLLGQSGGAHLVAGLLALRQDINCAVIGSGPLAPVRRPRPLDEPWLEHFNPASVAAAIARNGKSRIMVVTDPADKKVSARNQTAFVRMVEQAGRPVEQYIVQAIDENRHGVVAYSRLALSGCLRGASTEEIARAVDKLVQQRVAAARATTEGRADANKDNSTGSGHSQNHHNNAPEARPHTPEARPRAPEFTHGE
jgi:pimeloyl-ACP methyl ester carboxylesterase